MIVATTTNYHDDVILDVAKHVGVPVFRGSEDDVLSRFAGAARAHELDGLVRVTSDCPLIDPAIISAAVDRWRSEKDLDLYISNCLERTYPRGMDYEIFSAARLYDAEARATLPADREHVTPYLHQNRSGDMRLLNLPWAGGGASYRLCLDTPDDWKLLDCPLRGARRDRPELRRTGRDSGHAPRAVRAQRSTSSRRSSASNAARVGRLRHDLP